MQAGKNTIYRASAGSGKTFALTTEYLTLLFNNPRSYKHILAVTFTNKATGEMKKRIIDTLSQLKNGNQTPYLDILADKTGKAPLQLQTEAKDLLENILHDYSHFSVTTIDSFFQRVLQIFAKDIGIHGGYFLELDGKQVLSDVATEMLYDIDSDNDLKKWLTQLAQHAIQEGKSWKSYLRSFMRLGYELLSDVYKNKLLSDTAPPSHAQLTAFIKELRQLKDRFEQQMQQFSTDFLAECEAYELATTDFKYGKSSFANYFNKIGRKEYEPGKRTIDCAADVKQWSKKGSPKEDTINLFAAAFGQQKIGETLDYYDTHYSGYASADIVLKEMYNFGIINHLRANLQKYCHENRITLLSDTPHLISTIIGENDTPFLYEKLGNWYNHYMIDEFQDTSATQWHNFRPLLQNSLATYHANLIVGDVKQSIYRFRDSNWKILGQQLDKDFSPIEIENKNLTTNYRSTREIITFNNRAFQSVSRSLQDYFNTDLPEDMSHLTTTLIDAFADVEQQIPDNYPSKKTGCIRLEFDAQKETDDPLEKMIEQIQNLQDADYPLHDMVILVRSGSEGQQVVNHLLQQSPTDTYKYDFISNDSLYIRYSPAVRLLLNTLYWYNTGETFHWMAARKEASLLDIPLKKKEQITEFQSLPLYEMVEQLLRYYDLAQNTTQLNYIYAFIDCVKEFREKGTFQLSNFLRWWEKEGRSKTIKVSEGVNAITIMTIHKAKGLEFKAVLIPFGAWKLEPPAVNAPFLWCNPVSPPFNTLSPIPVKYSSKLAKSIFYKEYFEEQMQQYMDNLNLLYVAFTRAERFLWVNIESKPVAKGKSPSNMGQILIQALDIPIANNEMYNHSEGELQTYNEKTSNKVTNSLQVHPFSINEEIMPEQKVDFTAMFEITENPVIVSINQGNLYHSMLSEMKTAEDVVPVVQQFVGNGRISIEEGKDWTAKLQAAMQQSPIKEWFSEKYAVKNEQSILLPGGKSYRPDRIMISDNEVIVVDFKTGQLEEEKHIRQVRNYKNFVSQMGYSDVKGFVWYVAKDKIVAS